VTGTRFQAALVAFTPAFRKTVQFLWSEPHR
jgi:hypothetical protein